MGRNLLPVANIVVRLRMMAGESLREVRLGTTEEVLVHKVKGDWVEVIVPELYDHEIVAFEIA